MAENGKAPRFPEEWQEDGVVVVTAKQDPESRPLLYACPKCGLCHSPAIYVAKPEERHEAAKRAARECYSCMPDDRECKDCGAPTGSKGRMLCDECHCKRVLAKATEIPVEDVDECFGWGGQFYLSTDDAIEEGEEFVFPATFRRFHCDADMVIENILDDHFEDASEDDLAGATDLIKAIERFNEAQRHGSFDEDRSRYADLTKAEADHG